MSLRYSSTEEQMRKRLVIEISLAIAIASLPGSLSQTCSGESPQIRHPEFLEQYAGHLPV